MKVLSLISLLLVATNTLACPNLAGRYTQCKTAEGEVMMADLNLEQNTVNGFTLFDINYIDPETNVEQTIQYLADGQWHADNYTDPDSGVVLDFAIKAECINETLYFHEKMSMQGELTEVVSIEGTAKMVNNQLVVTNKGHAMGEEINLTVACD